MHQKSVLSAREIYRFIFMFLVACAFFDASRASAAEPRQVPPSSSRDETEKQCRRVLDKQQCPQDILPICQLAAELAERELGHKHLETALSLNNLGECLFHAGLYKRAEEVERQSLDVRIVILGRDNLIVARNMDNLADCSIQQGKLPEAMELFHRSLAIKRTIRAEAPHIADSFHGIASVLFEQGKYADAENIERQALTIKRETWGNEHASVALSLNSLGGYIAFQGKYSEAAEVVSQALEIRKRTLGSEHPQTMQSMADLAFIQHREGKNLDAEKLLRKVLIVRNRAIGSTHPDTGISMNNLATVLEDQGKYIEAEELYKSALSIFCSVFGKEHPLVAVSINNLASIQENLGNSSEAERLHRQVLSMKIIRLGNAHPDVAITLNNIGSVLASQGKFTEAEQMHRQALTIRERGLGIDHPDVAMSLNNLAFSLSRQAKYEEADVQYKRALEIRKRILGVDHLDVAVSLDRLARNYLLQRDFKSAIPRVIESISIQEKQLMNISSENRMLAILQSARIKDDIFGFLMIDNSHSLSDLAMKLTLLRKGRVSEAGALANRLAHRAMDRPSVKSQFSKWIAVRQQREFLLYRVGKQIPDEYQKKLIDLQIQADSMEHSLSLELPEIRGMHPPGIEEIIEKVAQQLPSAGVLVDLVWAKSPKRDNNLAQLGKAHYIALLLFPDRRIETIDVGEASTIDDLVSGFAEALARPLSDPKTVARALFDQTFAKLLPHLKGRTDVYLSLDGSLHLIPFDALHDGTDYLLGRYKFHYLTSGRDLLRKPSSQPVGPALVIGNPYFGRSANAENEVGSSVYQRLTTLSDLPWAQQEAESVANLLGVRAVTGASAKEELLRDRLAPSVVHLATHGLFLTDVAAPMSPGTRSSLLLASPPEEKKPASTEPPLSLPGLFGPMNRAALVFANARQGATVEDKSKDGLLTAEEARSLDLDGTQLVVLSACETGQGETSSGQGVYGLRRAFLSAGAETVVTSLWRVHDEATGELMTKYYGKLLDKQHPGDRLGAMIESMQELRARPGREHPYYWAPFLVIGADGPLRHTAMR